MGPHRGTFDSCARTRPGSMLGLTPIEEVHVADNNAGAAGGGAIYGLGASGALVFFWQQADGLWEHALSIFQGLFWPAFMVYQAFEALAR